MDTSKFSLEEVLGKLKPYVNCLSFQNLWSYLESTRGICIDGSPLVLQKSREYTLIPMSLNEGSLVYSIGICSIPLLPEKDRFHIRETYLLLERAAAIESGEAWYVNDVEFTPSKHDPSTLIATTNTVSPLGVYPGAAQMMNHSDFERTVTVGIYDWIDFCLAADRLSTKNLNMLLSSFRKPVSST